VDRRCALDVERDIAQTTVIGIGLDFKSQLPAHFKHDRILLKYLAADAAKALGFGVLNEQLHQGPAEASALSIRSQQDRIVASLAD
jgi:hypothetical protein